MAQDIPLHPPRVGLSLMPDADFRVAVAPLFDEGLVTAIEWTTDAGWPPYTVPRWIERLLDFYGGAGRLYAHGFGLSPLSGGAGRSTAEWLEQMEREVRLRSYRHVSEHLCFLRSGIARAGDLAKAGPLPMPMTARTIALGRARLEELARVTGLPVGLENLATSLSVRDALDQGAFLDALLEPIDGFVLLDVHNLFCQAATFELDPIALLETYPLGRVREIHVSGGSWCETSVDPSRPVRRDTHDGDVPVEVFEILDAALARCDRVEAVFLERLGDTLRDEADQARFREDYATMTSVVRGRARAREEVAHA